MDVFITGGQYFDGNCIKKADIFVQNGKVAALGQNIALAAVGQNAKRISAEGCVATPCFTDLHVHLRQPGFEEKESIATGCAAAAAGGFSTVCAMPNINPVPHSLKNLKILQEIIAKDASVQVLPYAAISKGQKGEELADIADLAPFVCGFTDDGRGVQREELMEAAMKEIAAHGRFVAAHCEILEYIEEGAVCVQENSSFAKKHGLIGHNNQSEWREAERDIAIAKKTGCRLHICHASAAETFELVRRAKKEGLAVTCEASPHNLLLCCDDISENSGRFCMNPPLRDKKDVEAAQIALQDGTVDAIATDHAPHTAAEKDVPFARSLNGVVGLETAFAACFTGLVKTGIISLEKLLLLLSTQPRKILGKNQLLIKEGFMADFVLLNLNLEKTVDENSFKTKGRATPFKGAKLSGWPVLAFCGGRLTLNN